MFYKNGIELLNVVIFGVFLSDQIDVAKFFLQSLQEQGVAHFGGVTHSVGKRAFLQQPEEGHRDVATSVVKSDLTRKF